MEHFPLPSLSLLFSLCNWFGGGSVCTFRRKRGATISPCQSRGRAFLSRPLTLTTTPGRTWLGGGDYLSGRDFLTGGITNSFYATLRVTSSKSTRPSL